MAFGLRPWSDADAEWYIAARDETILRWTTEPEMLSVAEFVAGLAQLDGRDRAGFALVGEGDETPLGNVAAIRRDDIAEISYWVAATARGRGAATAGLAAMTEWVLANWDVARIELLIHPDNLASVTVAERSGYRSDGTREVSLSCAGPDGTVAVYTREVSAVVS